MIHDDDITVGMLATVRPDRYTRATKWRIPYESRPAEVTRVTCYPNGRIAAIGVRLEDNGTHMLFTRRIRGTVWRCSEESMVLPPPLLRLILGKHPDFMVDGVRDVFDIPF